MSKTYIYSFKLKFAEGGTASGRVEAKDHREAQQRAVEQWSSYTVQSGSIAMLENQEAARKKHFIALDV